MKPHHKAWLAAHPHRTQQWFTDRLADGFDVHHLDADPENNAPDNLVLIEHTDHMRLHGMSGLGRLRQIGSRAPTPEIAQRRMRAYTLLTGDATWAEIKDSLGVTSRTAVTELARKAAQANGLPWPILIRRRVR